MQVYVYDVNEHEHIGCSVQDSKIGKFEIQNNVRESLEYTCEAGYVTCKIDCHFRDATTLVLWIVRTSCVTPCRSTGGIHQHIVPTVTLTAILKLDLHYSLVDTSAQYCTLCEELCTFALI